MTPAQKKLWDAIDSKTDSLILETLDAMQPGELDASLITAISKRGEQMRKGEQKESPISEQARSIKNAVKPTLRMAGA